MEPKLPRLSYMLLMLTAMLWISFIYYLLKFSYSDTAILEMLSILDAGQYVEPKL